MLSMLSVRAQDLSRFGNDTLVSSSNMLEHIPDVNKCLRECQHVLKNDGLMLHTMPSRYWKVFNTWLSILRRKSSKVHGTSRGHLQEYYNFGLKVWRERIESNWLKVTGIIGLPFYVGHGNTFIPIIKAGNVLELPASYLYVIRKK